ncbi:MAG: hypothetical protein M3T49_02355 [Candidatus Eremiobacteraeota bacterium]|nr:hypothetical protein [Candidatus Eremiobacteraeota bacterium]
MRYTKRRSILAVLLVAFVASQITACNSGTKSGAVTIAITGDNGSRSYSPGNVTVAAGTVVTWINQDSQPHTATAIGAFDSGPIPPNGGRWSWIASVPGTWTYHSLIQPDMTGTISVNAPATTSF